jgi:inner membrane transporter RhtA
MPAGHQPENEARSSLLARALAATPPPVLVLLSILSIQLGAAITVELYTVASPLALITLRLGFSALILMVATRKALDWRILAHAGPVLMFGIAIAAMNIAFYEAVARIPLGVAVTIEFIGPLGLSAITSRRGRDFLFVALAAAGVAMLMPQIGDGLDSIGVVLAAIAGLSWAGFVLGARHAGRHLAGTTGLAVGMTVATVLSLPFAALSGGFATMGSGIVLASVLLTLLSQTLPLSLEFEALKRLSPRTYGILVTLEPAVAVLIGALVLRQQIDARMMLAMALVTTAAVGVALTDRSRPETGQRS